MNTVLFLDIDGVLCTLRSHLAYGDKGGLMEAWDPTCCQLIRRLCKLYDCKIVISSTWRNHRRQILSYYLALYGLIDYVYNFPDFKRSDNDLDWKTPRLGGAIRGLEIQAYLNDHHEFKNYLIIDDDSDMLPSQMPFFIKTNTYEGFSSKNFLDCDELLKGFKNEKDY